MFIRYQSVVNRRILFRQFLLVCAINGSRAVENTEMVFEADALKCINGAVRQTSDFKNSIVVRKLLGLLQFV